MLNKTDNVGITDIDSMRMFFSDDGGTTWIVGKVDSSGRVVAKTVDDSGIITKSVKQDSSISELQKLNSLIPDSYDYVDMSYSGGNLDTLVFKTGGSGGSTISTISLSYDGSNNLNNITKT